MSYPVMNPAVPWSLVKNGFHKTPSFMDGTLIQKTATGRRSSISMKPYATWDFTVDLNLVLGGESIQYSVLQQFVGCFLSTCGRGGFFLFADPNDNTVDDSGLTTPQSCMLNVTPGAVAPMGTVGDGTSPLFQLARRIDQGVDILQQVSNVLIYVNGVEVSNYTLGDTGVVTFTTAPAAGAVLTWSGAFQYLCQFSDDSLKELARVSKNSNGWLWSCNAVSFESVFA